MIRENLIWYVIMLATMLINCCKLDPVGQDVQFNISHDGNYVVLAAERGRKGTFCRPYISEV